VATEPSSDLPEPCSWRWLVMRFPCLEAVTPDGRIVVVSDRRHIAEARGRFPDLVLWHVDELGRYGQLVVETEFDVGAFVAVNRLKLKSRGWFMGVVNASGDASTDQIRRSD
jgi:hypothetical protein